VFCSYQGIYNTKVVVDSSAHVSPFAISPVELLKYGWSQGRFQFLAEKAGNTAALLTHFLYSSASSALPRTLQMLGDQTGGWSWDSQVPS
jgi:hypothetical protein